MKIAIFASGSGTNFENIVQKQRAGELPGISIQVLIVDQANAKVIARAEKWKIPYHVVLLRSFSDKRAYETHILQILREYEVDKIVLAGYMKLISETLLHAYPDAILNIHPALLPAFPGDSAIADAYCAKATKSGVTVHYVDAGVDTGPIIAQSELTIDPNWTREEFETRIHALEYALYPKVLNDLNSSCQEGKMKVLVTGKGGREHALCFMAAKSDLVQTVYVAPGNVGMEDIATRVPISDSDIEGLAEFAQSEGIDLTIVGAEHTLELGIRDAFEARNLIIFAPTRAAARIETDKQFAKDLMHKYEIPTAAYRVFNDRVSAAAYVKEQGVPIVIKENGLKAGKGVTVALTLEQAEQALEIAFAQKGNKVVIEEFLDGFEFSLMCFVNDSLILPMELAQDHKRVYDNDEGPNTGGMGAFSPVLTITPDIIKESMRTIMIPTIEALKKEGVPFLGFLYGGLILTSDGVKTIEFNARFGDPEAQVILPRMESDLIAAIRSVMEGNSYDLKWSPQSSLGVVLASTGYPESSTSGAEIMIPSNMDSLVFHMGTAKENGVLQTAGGRVLCVVNFGDTLQEAYDRTYRDVGKIRSEELFHRKDIGKKELL